MQFLLLLLCEIQSIFEGPLDPMAYLLKIIPIAILLTIGQLAVSSFHDNPKIELPPSSGPPLDELKAKWDTDVWSSLLHTTVVSSHSVSGPSQASRHLPTSRI